MNISIVVVPANVKQFKDLVAKRQIPSKDRCVYLDGVPLTYSEQDIRLLFHGNEYPHSFEHL